MHSRVSPRKMNRRPECLRLEMAFPLWVRTTDSLPSHPLPTSLLGCCHSLASSPLYFSVLEGKEENLCAPLSSWKTPSVLTFLWQTEKWIRLGIQNWNQLRRLFSVRRETLNPAERQASTFFVLPLRNVLTPRINGEHSVQANWTCWDS